MKHIAGATLMLLSLLVSCVVLMKMVENCATETSNLVQRATEQADKASVETLLMQADQYWNSQAGVLGTVLRHDEIDKVGDCIAALKAYAAQEDWDEFYGTSAQLLASLSHIKEKEYPLFHNIM
jgi:hypothetical protein